MKKKIDIKKYFEEERSSKKPNVRGVYDQRIRDSLKKDIDRIYNTLKIFPNKQLRLIFLETGKGDMYVEKILKMGEIALDAAEWKPSEAKISAAEPFGFEFKGGEPKLYSKKNKAVAFNSGKLELRPTFEGNVKGTFLENDFKEVDREVVLGEHIKKLLKNHYLTEKEYEECLKKIFDEKEIL